MISANDEIELNNIVREWLRNKTDGQDYAEFVDEHIPTMIDEINKDMES